MFERFLENDRTKTNAMDRVEQEDIVDDIEEANKEG